jgi:hypothetical protein
VLQLRTRALRRELGAASLVFTAAQRFLGALSFRDIDHNADDFNNVSITIQNRMRHTVEVFDRAIG